jgi:FkbM family methyltransferase
LRPGDIFVDVGANVGLYSVIAGRLVGKTGAVYAFEPCKSTFDKLVENVTLNRLNNVSCHCVALSDQCGEATMKVSLDGYDAWNSFVQPLVGVDFTAEVVETITWDEFSDAYALVGRITMMKIDVEGWETRVLAGGARTFHRPDAPVLQVEFTDYAAHAAGVSCEVLYESLREMGYNVCSYQPQLRRIVPDCLRKEYPYVNLIAAKDVDIVNNRLEQNRIWRWQT